MYSRSSSRGGIIQGEMQCQERVILGTRGSKYWRGGGTVYSGMQKEVTKRMSWVLGHQDGFEIYEKWGNQIYIRVSIYLSFRFFLVFFVCLFFCFFCLMVSETRGGILHDEHWKQIDTWRVFRSFSWRVESKVEENIRWLYPYPYSIYIPRCINFISFYGIVFFLFFYSDCSGVIIHISLFTNHSSFTYRVVIFLHPRHLLPFCEHEYKMNL